MFPQPDKRIVVTSGKSAYQNTLAYTKNIDLSEDGVIKLAPPMARIITSEDSATFTLPYDLFRWSSGNFKIMGSGTAFNMVLGSAGGNVTEEGSFTGSDGLRVLQWVTNNWFMNQSAAVYDYTGGTASTTYTSRIANNLDFIEINSLLNRLVGRDADNVYKLLQYDSDFSASTTASLDLPQNFAITGVAFSGNQGLLGIVTKQRKNEGNAYFFTWDGADTSANQAVPVNDPYILDVAAYKSSWVILTFSGQLLYFNGGGFDELGRLPSFDHNQTFANLANDTSLVFGKLIFVDGDNIYITCPSQPELSQSKKPYIPFFAGGVYCFDPKHGLYHTASPSYSKYGDTTITFSSNVGTTAAAHFLETGDEIYHSSSQIIYYAIKLTDTTIKVATTYANAIAETSTTVTDGARTYFILRRNDYGQEALRLIDCGVVKKHKDFNGYLASGAIPYFLGAKLYPNNLNAARVNVLNIAVPIMHNRGYFVLGKFQTGSLSNMWQGVAVKYSKLKSQDKIIVKAKTKDQDPIIVGATTLYTAPYSGEGVTWDSTGTNFSTSADLTGAEEGDEVHVYAGPGAGQSAHITQINGSVSAGWEVLLDEPIRGTVSGKTSCVSIDKFKKLGTITSDDTDGVKRLTLGNPGPTMEIKIELRGIDVKVSEVIPLSAPHQLGV